MNNKFYFTVGAAWAMALVALGAGYILGLKNGMALVFNAALGEKDGEKESPL